VTRALLLLTLALLPARARAYLEPARFTDPVLEGGAGGRFFTGAPGDGYGCAVCHDGGAAEVGVEGLPEGGFEPGAEYDLALIFPADARSAGAVIEIADEMGEAVGALALVPEGELEDADRCRDDAPAVALVPADDRLLARAEVCGARRARVRWTAPDGPVSGVRLFASAVLGDDSGDPTGDPTVTLVRPLRARSAPLLEAGRLGTRCSAAAARADAPLLLALALLLAIARRRCAS
jgi:hypothetical protein